MNKMTLISFDVGIKNMAYCIFSLDSDKKEFKIKDWNVLNFTEYDLAKKQVRSNEGCSCQYSIEKKVKKIITSHNCGKNAKYHYGGIYYCELHAKKQASSCGLFMPKKEYMMSFLKKQKMDKLYEIAKRDFYMDFYSSPSLAIMTQKMKKQDLIDKIELNYSKKIIKLAEQKEKINASSMDLIHIGRVMKQMIDGISCIDEITHVIVENQISPIASRMKTIQGMIAQYFIMRETSEKQNNIEFISSANKLKGLRVGSVVFQTQEVNIENIEIEKKSEIFIPGKYGGGSKIVNKNYKANKKDGIDICNQFLKVNPYFGEWMNFFNEKPTKKDDLADCFLQGIYYMKLKNIIKNADDLKINLV